MIYLHPAQNSLQIKINEMYKHFEVNKQIKVDGIVGNETINACIDIFNLL